MTADEIIYRIKNKEDIDNEWFEIREEIIKFLKENPDSPDKRRFTPLGYLEVVNMICWGIEKDGLY